MFEAERAAILSLRDEGKIGAEVMRRVERHTDPEELRFQRLKEVTMSQIRAVLVDKRAPANLSLGEIEKPSPAPSEALVRVSSISLNRGEVRRAQAAEPGFNPGWDLAGTVEREAADETGPPAGARVVGLLPSAAWAELVAVPTNSLWRSCRRTCRSDRRPRCRSRV